MLRVEWFGRLKWRAMIHLCYSFQHPEGVAEAVGQFSLYFTYVFICGDKCEMVGDFD